MQKINDDENKVNLIKCPLPKIIYMSMKGLTTFTKKPEKSNNGTTYYTKKINNQQPGLPSLKMNTKFSFSPSKTNYVKGKPANNLNSINTKKLTNSRNAKIKSNDNNKKIKSKCESIRAKEIISKSKSTKYAKSIYGI